MSRLRRGLCGTTATTTETSVVCSYIFNPITSSLGALGADTVDNVIVGL